MEMTKIIAIAWDMANKITIHFTPAYTHTYVVPPQAFKMQKQVICGHFAKV